MVLFWSSGEKSSCTIKDFFHFSSPKLQSQFSGWNNALTPHLIDSDGRAVHKDTQLNPDEHQNDVSPSHCRFNTMWSAPGQKFDIHYKSWLTAQAVQFRGRHTETSSPKWMNKYKGGYWMFLEQVVGGFYILYTSKYKPMVKWCVNEVFLNIFESLK